MCLLQFLPNAFSACLAMGAISLFCSASVKDGPQFTQLFKSIILYSLIYTELLKHYVSLYLYIVHSEEWLRECEGIFVEGIFVEGKSATVLYPLPRD